MDNLEILSCYFDRPSPEQGITINGEKVALLFTPTMRKYSDLLNDNRNLDPRDSFGVWDVWVKIFYMAYLNAQEEESHDLNDNPEDKRDYSLSDFNVWAAGEGREQFSSLLPAAVYCVTGHTLGYYEMKMQQLN